MDIKGKLEIEREVRTFWDLNNASYVMLEKTKETNSGSYYTIMASIIFTAFSFEAYLNHLGDMKIKFWEEIEKIRVLDKYKVLCKEFDITPDFGKRPYQTLRDVIIFRNALAHGKSKILKFESTIDVNADIWEHEPKEKWEEYCTESNAIRAHEDIKLIITELNIAADEGEYVFQSGMTFGSLSQT